MATKGAKIRSEGTGAVTYNGSKVKATQAPKTDKGVRSFGRTVKPSSAT